MSLDYALQEYHCHVYVLRHLLDRWYAGTFVGWDHLGAMGAMLVPFGIILDHLGAMGAMGAMGAN